MEQRKLHNSAVAIRRQQQIEQCLYENLRHTDLHSISISDLCRQVGISRKAFYHYYPDKEACLTALIDHAVQESMLILTRADNVSPMGNTIALLEYWKEQKELLDILLNNNVIHLLAIRNMNYILREERTLLDRVSTPEIQSDTDILACYMACLLALVLQWHHRNFSDPTEEIARKMQRLLHVPMIVPGE